MRTKPVPRVRIATTILAFSTTYSLVLAQERSLRSKDLGGLELRNIGPATMSGRIVDLAVVESDIYTAFWPTPAIWSFAAKTRRPVPSSITGSANRWRKFP